MQRTTRFSSTARKLVNFQQRLYTSKIVNGNVNETFLSNLKTIFPKHEQVSIAESVRLHHGTSLTHHKPMPPDVVVFPHSTEEVSKIVSLCVKHQVPVIPFGAGTALEGHFDALTGGLSMDLSEMKGVVQFYPEDMNITVQAGITREELNEHIRNDGLFFPIDPGANATIGGMASTRASGTNAVRYGTMKENIVNVTCVVPDENGSIIKTNQRAKKSSAGYDLTSLMIGSEGTLGVITEVTVKLYGVPESIIAAVCNFPDLNSAALCVSTCIQMGIPLSRIELLDENCVRAVNKYSHLSLDDSKPMLLFEFNGSPDGVREQVDLVQQVAQGEYGASDFKFSEKEEDRQALWKARHHAYFASLALRPGSKMLITDVCVPISRLAECIVETKQDVEASGILYTVVGHVGDGNFHTMILLDENNPQEIQKAHDINERLVNRAIRMDGTCTGEHGIGHGKMHSMLMEHGPDAVELMRVVKKAIDPLNIMNPYKILPSPEQVAEYRQQQQQLHK
jgi:D-lactate dehydrogenase (cytochrome)